jgi:diguanylate cyclase (GGDEF)-like protein
LVIVAGFTPILHGISASVGLSLSSTYLIATIVALWPGAKSKLPARWPIIGFAAAHAAILAVGAYSTWNGTIGGLLPPLLSSFGLIHFESIIFAVGTAVFVLALVNERSEAVTRIAAGIDSLTGIANRAAFTEDAIAVVVRCHQKNAPVSVIMFDLDRFKAVNDTYGHAVGDAVIKKFCEVTTAALRPGDIFGRLGGEEFAVVLPWSSIEPACIRADRIRVGFAEACRKIGDGHINSTVSGGVSVSDGGEATLSELLAHADEALYLAKAAGRNRIKRADQPAPARGASVIRVA